MQTQLIFHGSVILFASLLCGASMGRSINAGKTDDVVRGWRVARNLTLHGVFPEPSHTGLVRIEAVNGVIENQRLNCRVTAPAERR